MKPARLGGYLAAALFLTASAILGVKDQARMWPSISSDDASGLSAFARLMEKEGYKTVLSRSPNPRLAKGDLPVLAMVEGGAMDRTRRSVMQDDSADVPSGTLLNHLRRGGAVLAINMPESLPFDNESDARRDAYSRPRGDRMLEITAQGKALEPGRAAFYEGGSGVASEARCVAGGTMLVIRPGFIASNRFLDKAENAAFLLDHVQSAAPRGSRLVFVESVFGNGTEDSIVGALGSWAAAARYQFCLLAAVAAFALSRRFGMERPQKGSQRSARDMIDALAQLLRGGRRSRLALRTLVGQAEARLRKALKAPPTMSIERLLMRLPASAVAAFHEAVEAGHGRPVSQAEAVRLIRRLEREVVAIEHDSRTLR